MSKPTAPASFEVDHPPLARDSAGNLLPFPDGTAAWRIARETGGRLFEIRGSDRAWIRIATETTAEHIAEQWGPGIYRVYALDAVGGSLQKEHVARWDLRNAGSESFASISSELRNGAVSAPTGSTDLRYALEAMTQMLRTNSDALRVVAESHVDLAKSIAAAKGLPRNANPQALRALPPAESEDPDDPDDEDDEDDDYTGSDAGVPAWVNQVLVPLAPVIKLGSDYLSSKLMPKGDPLSPSATTTAGVHRNSAHASEEIDMDLVRAPDFEARDLANLDYCYRKNQAKRAYKAQQDASSSSISLTARVMHDPALVERIMAIKTELSPEDGTLLMQSVESAAEEQQTKLLAALKSQSVSQAVEFARTIAANLREGANVRTTRIES